MHSEGRCRPRLGLENSDGGWLLHRLAMAFRLLSRLPRGSLPFCRYKSTSTVVQAVEGIRQLAQPVAFVSVKGWEPEGVA